MTEVANSEKSRANSSMVAKEIARYLNTGESDSCPLGYADNAIQSMACHKRLLLQALCTEVKRRARGLPKPFHSKTLNLMPSTQYALHRMIAGLFPKAEREIVRTVVDRSIVFLSADVVYQAINAVSFLHTAWIIANVYLESINGKPFAPRAEVPVGFNEEMICYVSTRHFETKNPFANYVVHEAAHIFHNCKRNSLRLPYSKKKEWLLDIDFRKRETFAYGCEFYGCIHYQTKSSKDRRLKLGAFASQLQIVDARVDQTELLDILSEAVGKRNGWKIILKRCSPS